MSGTMKYQILFMLFFVTKLNLLGQCLSKVSLCSQTEVDQFIRKYGVCGDIDTLVIPLIACSTDVVTNLDSLKNVKTINWLELSNNFSLEDIDGLSGLRRVNFCFINGHKKWKPFLHLDTIERLKYEFPIDSIIDMSLFRNVSFIRNNIEIIGNAKLSGLSAYKCGEMFGITVINLRRKEELLKILPINYENVFGIALVSAQQVITDNMPDLINLESIRLLACRNIDVSGLMRNSSIKSVELISCNTGLDFGPGFQTKSLDVLFLFNNRIDLNLETIFPKLEEILVKLIIRYRNDSLKSLAFFDNFELPTSNTYRAQFYYRTDSRFHIDIEDNINLNTCESDFMCRAFKLYPDSVKVFGNSYDCNSKHMTESCVSSVVDKIASTYIYPNPSSGTLIINFNDLTSNADLRLYDMNGRNVYAQFDLTKGTNTFDLSDLPAATYIYKIYQGNKIIGTGEWVKM